MAQLKCILWDLDNTLWDFDGNASLALHQLYNTHQLGNKLAKTAQEFAAVYSRVNAAYWTQYEKGEVDKETLRTRRFVDSLKEMGLDEDEQPVGLWKEYLDICHTIPNLMPHVLEVVKELSGTYKMGLVTNGFEITQHIKIECSGLKPYFDFLLSSEHFGFPKPDKRIFEEALRLANYKADECIYIGDNLNTDVMGGLNAGIRTAWYTKEKEEINHPLYLGEIENLQDFVTLIKDL